MKPALLPGEAEDADESPHSITLTVVVLRHFEAMLSAWLPLTSEPSPAAAKHQSEVSVACKGLSLFLPPDLVLTLEPRAYRAAAAVCKAEQQPPKLQCSYLVCESNR